MTYLYLGSDVEFSTSTSNNGNAVQNEIRWSGGEAKSFLMTGAGWLDINAAYTERINVTGMSGGTVYLNEHGMLGGTTLAASSSVEAEAVLSLSDIAATPYTQSKVVGDNLWVVTRDLLTSNTADGYNNWGGTVTLNFGGEAGQLVQSPLTEYSKEDIGKYWVIPRVTPSRSPM